MIRRVDDGAVTTPGAFGRIAVLALALAALLAWPAMAESGTVEERLREALRRVTVDLRAAQDSQATLQAALDQMKRERDALQLQVTRLATQAAKAPPPPPAPAGPSPQELADAQHLRDAAKDLARQNAALQEGLSHWQTAYQQAASLAQAKDAQARQASTTLDSAQATLGLCEAKNAKLAAIADDILHLYQTPKFRSMVAGSWEPLLGYKQVELENVVQDHEDQIRDQHYYPGQQPAPPKATTAANTGTP
jgi:DNA repair exonuclease SbcCD ATPase subunit